MQSISSAKARPCKKVLTFSPTCAIIKTIQEKGIDTMKKVIICEKCPTSACYYKILRFLLEHATRKEIEGYLDELEKSFEQWKLLKILFILTIDKLPKMWYNCAARARPTRAEIPLYHRASIFVNSFFAQILTVFFPVFCALFRLAIHVGVCYT